ncbi:MAG: flavodoxin family protein, partial [Bacteroidia bacterium]|nr:flavodoxin family protein [Bacteroidia bacterium]
CESFRKSEAICFATPVYWWGVSSQVKVFIDRLYQLRMEDFKGKKLYVIASGEDTLDGVQYRLIREQFEQICEYTGMEFAGYLPVCAGDDNPARENTQALQQARELIALI